MYLNGGYYFEMAFLLIVLVFCIAFIIVMVIQAFENNVVQHEIQLKGVKEQVTLFFISDIHLRKIDNHMIRKLNKNIDAVIIGGDFADRRTPISRIYQNLYLLQKLGPVYFVWGNNDREVGEERLRRIFKEVGVCILENDAVLLPNVQNECWISAIDDTSTMNDKINQAFEKCCEKDNVIFISHNPQIFPKVRKQYHVNVLLGGHFHGGQIRFGPLGFHEPGSFLIEDGVATLISNGYGTTLLPMRFGAKPQCHIIDLNFSQ